MFLLCMPLVTRPRFLKRGRVFYGRTLLDDRLLVQKLYRALSVTRRGSLK